jgi:predicted SAM-dependent methyltransferase
MVQRLKERLKRLAKTMSGWPVIGRFVRIGVAIVRLPQFHAAFLDQNRQQHVFVTQQLPTLLETISDINSRQLRSEGARDNLVKSVPLALRRLTRDLVEIQKQIASMSQATEQRFDTVGQRVDATQDHVEHLSRSVGYLLGRVEFVRRELMYEMRYGPSAPSAHSESIKAKTAVIAAEKLAMARADHVRLNLGSGHVPLDGYLNVDRRALPGVDIVAEVDELPFEPGEIDEIFSAHLLEHFPKEQLTRQLLTYWHGLLKPGGEFRAVVPDAEGMIRAYSSGEYPFDRLRHVTFGGQDYDGDFHFNMFTVNSLSELLRNACFTEIEVVAENRENAGCKEFEIRARRAVPEDRVGRREHLQP